MWKKNLFFEVTLRRFGSTDNYSMTIYSTPTRLDSTVYCTVCCVRVVLCVRFAENMKTKTKNQKPKQNEKRYENQNPIRGGSIWDRRDITAGTV
jgi:hypothetical protein